MPLQQPADEVKRLRRCIIDLVSVLALPAIWSGGGAAQVVSALLEALFGMLNLDFVYVRLSGPLGEAPIETIRTAQPRTLAADPEDIRQLLNHWLGDDPETWPPLITVPIGDADISIVPLPLGLQGQIGVIAAGSQRSDFPEQTERLLLGVAVNQAAIGLQESRLLGEQKRVADELDRRVAERTAKLASVNEELKRSEALLAESERLSSTGSFIWCIATDEIMFSEELNRIFEFEQDAPVTLERIGRRVHPEDIPLWSHKIDQARAGIVDHDYEIRLRLTDDSVKYLHAISYAARRPDGQLEFIGAVQDITERRLAEETLGKVRSELAHVARITSLGALTASIAHEVNQPLSGIITNAGTCLRMLTADPPNVDGARETAQRTIRDGQRASDVIKRLRALFAKQDVTTEFVDLNEAVREVLALTWSELQRGGVILRAELADALPPVMGDRVQLQQVVLNLLLNAAEAMKAVDDRPRELVIRSEGDGDDHVRLIVKDAGVGLAAQGANKLFEPFYTTKHGGMGMGLSISRSIIESHRGRLWATPNEGYGASFAFSLPLRAEVAAEAYLRARVSRV